MPISMSAFVTLAFCFRPAVKNLYVTSNNCVTVDKSSTVVKTSFLQLHFSARVKPLLNWPDLEKAIHAFLHSSLDYWC